MLYKKPLRAFIKMSVLTGLAVTSAQAIADNGKDNINPWQHCGIGAAIFDSNETAAALSNVIWDSGTTAVTSATISPGTCASEKMKVAQFIDDTYDALARETAAGEGEHLQAVIGLAGCQASVKDAAVQTLREGLRTVSADESYSEMNHADKSYQFYKSLNSIEGCSLS